MLDVLIPAMGGFAWTIVAFVVALSVIVAIHEYGHYIVGRWSGIRAEVFSIGFGPVVWSRTDKRGTVWQFAALPCGGYVKFAGDANAASVGAEAEVAYARDTMPGAPLWARSATVAAGPIFNFILSILVFAAFVVIGGQAVDEARVGEVKDLPSDVVVLEEGDEIIAINGEPVSSLADVLEWARDDESSTDVTYTVERNGQTIDVAAAFPLLPTVDSVQPRSAAIDAGLEVGDYIRAVNGMQIKSFDELRTIVGESDGAALDVSVWRAGETLDIALSPKRMDIPLSEGGFETRWLIGITGGLFFEPVTERAGLWEAAQYGVNQTWFIMTSSLSALYNIAVGAISTCNLSGPVGIAETAGATASMGFESFVWFIAVLSTAVGLLNLFPIPVLDGGHLVFHAYEAVTGRKPSDTALKYLMAFGLTLMALLMVFALSQDFLCP